MRITGVIATSILLSLVQATANYDASNTAWMGNATTTATKSRHLHKSNKIDGYEKTLADVTVTETVTNTNNCAASSITTPPVVTVTTTVTTCSATLPSSLPDVTVTQIVRTCTASSNPFTVASSNGTQYV